MFKVIKPGDVESIADISNLTIFLAGSIEMGKAVDWQTKLTASLSNHDYVTLFNPRRDDWDPTWEQTVSNSNFVEQVEWELEHIALADLVVFFFDPKTQSPITLLELGAVASSGKPVVVFCEDGYFKKGNVDITCSWFSIPTVDSFEELVDFINSFIDGEDF